MHPFKFSKLLNNTFLDVFKINVTWMFLDGMHFSFMGTDIIADNIQLQRLNMTKRKDIL